VQLDQDRVDLALERIAERANRMRQFANDLGHTVCVSRSHLLGARSIFLSIFFFSVYRFICLFPSPALIAFSVCTQRAMSERRKDKALVRWLTRPDFSESPLNTVRQLPWYASPLSPCILFFSLHANGQSLMCCVCV
jgi:hypothetical protein